MGAREDLLARFAGLSPKLQMAARFVVDHPAEVVTVSMRTLAERAGAQPASLVRLAQHLGYPGWPQLKEAFAQDLGLHAEGYGQRARSLAARGAGADLLGEMFAAQQGNLAAAEAMCQLALKDAARLLQRAAAVHVAGFRASYPVAYALVYGYRLFRDTVHLVDGQGGALEMQLRPMTAKDALVVASFAPYSSEALAVVGAAQAVGARIVALTDSRASPLALAADVALIFSAASPSFFPSVTAAVAVSEALLELIVADAGDAVAKRIDAAEQRLLASGAYVPTAGPRRAPRKQQAGRP
jgi:DNA-binding MurR/RpiR family transcriptional regulator